MQFKDWLNVAILIVTAIAIIVGPIMAVRISLRVDASREKLRRKYQTFHALMRTRRVTLSPDHVTALNVIQTEFHDDDRVIAAYKKYLDNLGMGLLPGSTEEARKKFVDDRDDAFNDMMFEIGKHLGFSLDKRELAKYSLRSARLGRCGSSAECRSTACLRIVAGQATIADITIPAEPISG